jgi:hypothetical protein
MQPHPDWCTSEHGATLHPDDEDHRSSGVAVPLTVRTAGSAGVAAETDAEIGLLRRRSDSTNWLVIEDGANLHVELTLDSARRLVAAVSQDPVLRAAIAAPGD